MPAVTVVHTFRPTIADPAAVPTRTGTCWTSSTTVANRSAYRCLAQNAILDPCFAASRRARTVDCYADPWSKPMRIRLTERLPALSAPFPGRHAWALRLVDGTRCVSVTGVVQVVGNVALTYSCGSGTGAAAGLTRPTGQLRTALFRAGPHATLTQVDVAELWYG